MPLAWPDKDPDDIWDVSFTVEGFPASLGIAQTEATVTKGTVAIDAHAIVPDTTSTTTRLSGGVLGETCEVRIRTTMDDGQRVDQTMMFRIVER